MLGILGQPAKENAIRGKLDGSQFDVGFLEEAIHAQNDLELRGDFLCWNAILVPLQSSLI